MRWFVSKREILAVLAILIVAASLLIASAREDSPITDEPVHLLSGYLILKEADFSLNPEHPPLSKIISALPLLFVKPRLYLSPLFLSKKADFYYDSRRELFEEANRFVYEENKDKNLVFLGRLPSILTTLILIALTFFIAKKIFNEKVALTSAFLLAFQPTLLAHGRFITSDVYVTLGFLVASFLLYRYSNRPTLTNALLAGFGVALANLFKFSALILFPTLLFYYLYFGRKGEKLRNAFWGFLLVLLIIWMGYGFEYGLGRGSTGPIPSPKYFVYELKLLPLPILRDYLKGVLLILRENIIGRPSYLMGKVSETGFPFYLLFAWLFKSPLLEVIFVFVLLFFALKRKVWQSQFFKEKRWFFFPIFIFILFALISRINIGIRHLLPVEPFIAMGVASYLTSVFSLKNFSLCSKKAFYFLLFIYFVSSLRGYPNFVAYFNELISKERRADLLLDSNLDWGQDLIRLKRYLEEKKIKQIYIAYSWDKRSLDYFQIPWVDFEQFSGKGVVVVNVNSFYLLDSAKKEKILRILQNRLVDQVIGASLNLYEFE